MNLSPHFTLEELIASQDAARNGIDNRPPPAVIEVLRHTAQRLEDVRALLGSALIISSGYRCLKLNRRLKSSDTSQHVAGQAVDFACAGFGDTRNIVYRIRDTPAIDYDQLICEYPDSASGGWVHISFVAGRAGRRQTLTIDVSTPNGRPFA